MSNNNCNCNSGCACKNSEEEAFEAAKAWIDQEIAAALQDAMEQSEEFKEMEDRIINGDPDSKQEPLGILSHYRKSQPPRQRLFTIDGRMPYYPVIVYQIREPYDPTVTDGLMAYRRRAAGVLTVDHGNYRETISGFREEWNKDGFQIFTTFSGE